MTVTPPGKVSVIMTDSSISLPFETHLLLSKYLILFVQRGNERSYGSQSTRCSCEEY